MPSSSLTTDAPNYYVLIVDDEPDIQMVTRLGLKGLRYREQKLKLVFASSGKEAIDVMRANPQIAVILLDVVMENSAAGLNACKAIREELGNHQVRILLRTGQPGAAPEKKTIDDYDIDDYLAKTEITTNRLNTSVCTALKSWEELLELERQKAALSIINSCVVSLRSFEPIEKSLQRILTTAVEICPSSLAILRIKTFGEQGESHHHTLHLATAIDSHQVSDVVTKVVQRIDKDPKAKVLQAPCLIEGGYLMPFSLHREQGYGWIYLDQVQPDGLAANALPLLSAHASNALYSSVAQTMLAEQVEQRTKRLSETNSELENTLQRLKVAQDQLIQSEMMAALGGLVSGLAHELNTPLGVCVTASSYVADGLSELQQQFQENRLNKDGLKKFLSNASTGMDLVDPNLKQMGKYIRTFKQLAVDYSDDKKVNIDLHNYIHQVIQTLSSRLEKHNIQVVNEVSNDLMIHTHPMAIFQITKSLMVNSIEHGFGQPDPANSKLPKIIFSGGQSNGIAKLLYKDNGLGLDETSLDKIFEPFYTSKRGQGFVGLGMAIAFNLVNAALKGTISVSSTPGDGVQFTIEFPLKDD